jgi:glutamyl-tRNA reductase
VRLALIHRPRGAPHRAPAGRTWTTCLRDILFITDPPGALVAHEPVLTEAAAYALLLEVVCGLRSPLVGETEVQAQFKAFLASLDPADDGWLQRLGQRVLADAKHVRTRHLQGFGAHSYARLALTRVTATRLAIIGAGALAQEILQRLDPSVPVDLWGRRDEHPAAAESPVVRYLRISTVDAQDSVADPTSLIIAAPASPGDVAAVVRAYPALSEVIDLRAADEVSPIARAVPVVTLAALFSAIDEPESSPPGVRSALDEIQRLAQDYVHRQELHPFGWDDLCA